MTIYYPRVSAGTEKNMFILKIKRGAYRNRNRRRSTVLKKKKKNSSVAALALELYVH